MKKHIIRREAIKYKNSGKTYKETIKFLQEKFNYSITKMTLIRWIKRLDTTEWDLKDKSTKPKKLQTKFSEKDEKEIINLRKFYGYGAKKLRIQIQRKSIFMSISTIKRIIRQTGLSKGSKMEGKRLKWVRFERPDPNYMWQIDGDQNDDGTWRVPVVDDCSRYCIGLTTMEHQTTKAITNFLDKLIKIHGKPRQILTDNGSEFGGRSKNSKFDKWCRKRGIQHIRSGLHKPQTVGKVGAIQNTIQKELPNCNEDLELWRRRYNHDRPHESLRGLTPATVYFQFRRHKKHYEL